MMLRALYVDFFIQTLFKTRVCGFNFYISSIFSVHASIFSQIRLERIEGPPVSTLSFYFKRTHFKRTRSLY